jgi:tryptophan synthase alpha chain
MGITGTRDDLDAAARTLVERLRAVGAETVCVGVGISTPEQVRAVCGYADGAIVGSLLVATLDADGVDGVRAVAAALASGTNNVKP